MVLRVLKSVRIPSRYSLRFTLGASFAGLALFVSLVTGVAMYVAISRHIRTELSQLLAEAAQVAVLQIDPEQHRRLRTRADEATEAYAHLKRQLQAIRDQCVDVKFAYTMRLDEDGQVVFVVDAEEGEKDLSHVGDPYPHDVPQLRAALTAPRGTRRAFVDEDFVTDEWGTSLSGYVPFYTPDGRLEGVLGLDMSAETALAYERRTQFAVLLMRVVIIFIVVPVGVAVGQRIRRPLVKLEAEMAKIGKFELDDRVSIFSRVIEIESMIHQLQNMKGGLRSFRKYVPADLVRQLMELGVEAEPGGQREEVTIFFSDIADFTSVSERLTPEQLVEFLGEYLSEVTTVLLRHGATVDKYIGDAVMAFWNAPVRQPDHAERACRAALECRERIAQLNRVWEEQGRGVVLQTRMGINTGEVIVGNIGSEQRLSYTIIGDSVNLASRLEGANKFYGTDILVAGSTYELVRDRIVGCRVDRVAVKGKQIPIDIYQILGTREGATPAQVEWAECYCRGFDLYAARRFAEAAGVLEELLRRDDDDRVPRRLLARCHHFLTHPPAAEWDGSYAFSEK
jgi:class 3 adenylate cyclase